MTEEGTAVYTGEGHAREAAVALRDHLLDLAAIFSEALVNGVDVLCERLEPFALPSKRASKAEVIAQELRRRSPVVGVPDVPVKTAHEVRHQRFRHEWMVDGRGIEPLTSALRTPRSPS